MFDLRADYAVVWRPDAESIERRCPVQYYKISSFRSEKRALRELNRVADTNPDFEWTGSWSIERDGKPYVVVKDTTSCKP